jgi:hypothetical protein
MKFSVLYLKTYQQLQNSEYLPHFDLGKPKTKSIEMSTSGSLGIGKGIYKL